MTNAAVADPPKTGTDTGADPQGVGDTGVLPENGKDTDSAVQTGAKPEETTTAAPSSPDGSAPEGDENQETPEQKRARELEDARIEAKAQDLEAKRQRDAEAKAQADAKQKAADERKTKRATVKGQHTRALSAASNVLAEAGLDDGVIDKALAPFKTHHLNFSGLLDGEYEAAAEDMARELHGILRDLLPEDKRPGLQEAIQSETELEYFQRAIDEIKSSVTSMTLDDFLKANPKARADHLSALKAEREAGKDEGLNTHRGQPTGTTTPAGTATSGLDYDRWISDRAFRRSLTREENQKYLDERARRVSSGAT